MPALKKISPVVSSCPINLCLPQLGQLKKAAKFLISSLLFLLCLQRVEVCEQRRQQKTSDMEQFVSVSLRKGKESDF